MALTKITVNQLGADSVTTAKIADDVELGGSPTTTTQSAGNNSTRIATTAYTEAAITALTSGAALNEYIADTVGAMVGSNTESGITVAYQDGDNTLDFTVGTLNQNTTGTAATVTTAAQPAITSVGTLTALTVDEITINGNTIVPNSGHLNLTPAGGSSIILDGAIYVDAGVVTGATSITSTAFVGGLTGNVTGNASGTAATVTTAAQPAITSVGTLSSLAVGNITTTGYLRAPASFTIDPATHGDDTGTVVIAGNLQVDGTTTTINSTTVAIDDLNFSIATDAANSAAANGAGITIGGAGATLLYTHATTSWDMNKPLNVTGALGVSGVATFGTHIVLGDSDELRFGAGNDARIFSDGTNGYIRGVLALQNSAGNKDFISAADGGATTLYHDNAAKFATNSGGVTVTGTAVLGGASFVDNATAYFGTGLDLRIYHDASNSYIKDTGTGALRIAGSQIILRNAADSGHMLNAVDGGAVTLYHNTSARLDTTSGGVTVTGTLTPSGVLTANAGVTSNGNLIVNPDTAGKNTFRLTSNAANDAALLMNSDTTLKVSIQANASSYFNGGNVGIGTTSPDARLDIEHASLGQAANLGEMRSKAGFILNSDTGFGSNGLTMGESAGTAGSYFIGVTNGAGSGSYPLNLQPYGGNVGIGTTSPDFKLDVAGIIALSEGQQLAWHNGSGSEAADIYADSSDNLIFRNTSSTIERMRIDSAGRVSFGPDAADIQIDPASTNSGINLLYLRGNASGDKAEISLNHYGHHNYHIGAGLVGDGKFSIGTAQTDAGIVMDTSGKVGIGTASPGYVLHTKSSDSINTWLQSTHATDCKLQFSSATTDDYSRIEHIAGVLKYSADIAAAVSGSGHQWLVDGGVKMTIDSSGFVGIGETDPKKALHITRGDSDLVLILDQNNVVNDQQICFAHDYGAGSTTGGNYWALGVDGSENELVIAYDANSQASVSGDRLVTFGTAGQIGVGGANYGSSGQVLTSGGSGAAPAWGDAGGGAYSDWSILTTTPTTLVAKGQYICNDTTARTHTLPAGSAEDTITICNAGTGLVTLARTSSQKINSADADGTLPQGNSVQLVYVDSTIGWFEV